MRIKDGFDKISEECAVFGVSVLSEEAAGITYNGLLSLQHRGQESAGIAVIAKNKIICHKDIGLASEVFSSKTFEKFPPSVVAVGHTRYSTTGNNKKENAGPFVTEYLTGRIATAHNGNITNARQLKEELLNLGLQFNSTSDSEVISSLIAYYTVKENDELKGVIKACNKLEGAFSIIILYNNNKLIVVRDPNGYRPLCIGENDNGTAVSSESCALDGCGFKFGTDVKPGEIVVIEKGAVTYRNIELHSKKPNCGLCVFEYVYFARPDSKIDGLGVYEARYNMGKILAEEHPVNADAVCGVPDSGIEAAIGYSNKSGIPLVSGFVKNRYIGRSFIFPSQSQRENAVRLKLNPVEANVKNKKIVLVDDSIVRGTTIKKIVGSLKDAGAKEVHLRISSPPFRFTCAYGTDIDSDENLIANKISIKDICSLTGANSLGYISVEGLLEACIECETSFCTNCFTGNNSPGSVMKNNLE